MKLTDRLLKIADLVTKGKKIADIGTDHGYIPVYLLNKGHVDFAILADVNKGPLENARSEVRHNNLTDKVDLRLGSGIEVLNENEVDEVIRKYLLNNGYEILDEVLVKEDFRIYEIIVAKYTSKNTVVDDEIYYEVGKKLIENKDPLLNEFIDKKIFMYNSILKKLEGKTGEEIEKKIKISTEKISKLENLKK